MKSSYKGPFRSATVEMIRSVVQFAFAPANVATTSSIAAFFDRMTTLQTNLAEIDSLRQIADQQIAGYAAQKKALKASLVNLTTAQMQAVYSYAVETGDSVLASL